MWLVHEHGPIDKVGDLGYSEWLALMFERTKARGDVNFVIINTIDCSKLTREMFSHCCYHSKAGIQHEKEMETRLTGLEVKPSPTIKPNCAIFVMHDKKG